MAITPLPSPPLRSNPDTFSEDMENFLTALPDFAADLNEAATLAQLSTTTTSTTSNSIGTGTRTFAVPSGLGFAVGMALRIANSGTNFMTADVVSYVGTSLVVNSTSATGSGTFNSWSISQAAVGANVASAVSFAPAGNIAASNVQAAIVELDNEKLSNAAGAVTSTNLNSIVTAGSVGNQANIPTINYDAKGRITGTSSTAKISNGTPIATTSGTAHDFTGIPSTAKRITIMFDGVSTSGTSPIIIQIGSGAYSTTGYFASAGLIVAGGVAPDAFTTGFAIEAANANVSATSVRYGQAVINAFGNTKWAFSSVMGYVQAMTNMGAGMSPALSGALDRVRITTENGSDTFDAGSINIMWE
jgi:hypothetical protein